MSRGNGTGVVPILMSQGDGMGVGPGTARSSIFLENGRQPEKMGMSGRWRCSN